MEDYSEYESVDEEKSEEPVPKPGKPTRTKADGLDAKSSAKKKAEAKAEQDKEPRKTIRPAPLKKTASSGGSKVVQKGSIMNFFGKK